MKLTRIEFLKTLGLITGGVVTLPLSANIISCAASKQIQIESVRAINGRVDFNISKNKALSRAGDYTFLEIEGSNIKIYLIRKSSNSFLALDTRCTHLGCEIIKRETFFECPCHGSEFDLDGKVLQGPASVSLKSYRTEFDNYGNISIYLQ
ncbi:MAG: ubiquinol-cytochrome c reductase iron-sulfur subunit [Ignavibacteria bacterium]